MAKKAQGPLAQSDLEEFLQQSSDFSFEMATLNVLRDAGFETDHAATYVDPLTAKMRAYDLRARWQENQHGLRLAVECKCLRRSSPLLVHTTPREEAESYHTLVKRMPSNGWQFNSAERVIGSASVYRIGQSVGRQIDQPIRDGTSGFRSSDGPTFDKWTQAVNGCADLLAQVRDEPMPSQSVHGIVPILVVPEGCLWQVDYDSSGRIVGLVREVSATTIILRHAWSVPTSISKLEFDISHLEIVTLPALAIRAAFLRSVSGLFATASTMLAKP